MGSTMKSVITATLIISGIAIATLPASAGERVNEALMGAGSGALVAGPVGLVAGGVIGYTAGPNIRRGMGIGHRGYRHRHYRQAHR
jgi:hypothetical protein